jgi:hypothetical protein
VAFNGELQTGAVHRRTEHAGDVRCEPGQIRRLKYRPHASSLQTGEIEQRVHEFEQSESVPAHREQLLVTFGTETLVDRAYAFAHLAATAEHRLDQVPHVVTRSRLVSSGAARRYCKRSPARPPECAGFEQHELYILRHRPLTRPCRDAPNWTSANVIKPTFSHVAFFKAALEYGDSSTPGIVVR